MKRFAILAGLLALSACEAAAPPTSAVTAEACALPQVLAPARMEPVRPDEVVAGRPIRFHMLAVSWMPETCRAGDDGANTLACEDNRFGWTLHGLWPNSDGRPYPRFCRPADRVPTETVRANLCRTPSVDLVQHEWAAHGTCGWETPEAYFRQSAALYDGLKRPDPTAMGTGGRGPTAGQLRDAFARLNPGLPREAVYIAVASRNRLREVRLCHDLEFRPRACPGGDLGTPDPVVLTVEPLRGERSPG